MLRILEVNYCSSFQAGGVGSPAWWFSSDRVSSEEDGAGARTMDLDVTCRAIRILRILVMGRTCRLNGTHTVIHAVARQTQLVDCAVLQQTRIRGAVRNVTGRAALGFNWRVFKNEWPLFVGVAFNAGGIGAGRESGLFQLKTAVRIVAIAALQRAFKHFVMKGCVELMFDFSVAAQAELRVIHLQHLQR